MLCSFACMHIQIPTNDCTFLHIIVWFSRCPCRLSFFPKVSLIISNVTLYMSTGVTLCVATVYVWTAGTALRSHDWVVIHVFEAERASKGSLFTTGVWKSWAGSLALQGWIMLPVGLSPLPLLSLLWESPASFLSLTFCSVISLCVPPSFSHDVIE